MKVKQKNLSSAGKENEWMYIKNDDNNKAVRITKDYFLFSDTDFVLKDECRVKTKDTKCFQDELRWEV